MKDEDSCDFYGEISITIPGSRERRADRQVTEAMLPKKGFKPYCEHPNHSPFTYAQAKRRTIGSGPLKCEGCISKCPLTQQQFSDI